jgi:arabinoxylan arabinofuranohydrolase
MKTKLFTIAIVIIALAFGFALSGCADTEKERERERVTVTFDIGYEGGASPAPVTIFKGTAVGAAKWPRSPSRNGYSFQGWYKGSSRYTANTVINEDVTVTARWDLMSDVKPQPPSAEIAALFTENFPAANETRLSDSRKIWGMNNPVITFAYLADPTPMVFCHADPPCIRDSGDTESNWCDQDRLYLYGSNDTLAWRADGTPEPSAFSTVIQGLRIISSADLVNWTDHGVHNFVGKTSTHPLFPGPFERIVTYADDTWAPSAEWKIVNGKPQFYLYWCNSGNNTSVVVSDESPLGPWRNPGLTASMINKNMTDFTTVSWLFDPGTMIDYDGTGYMVLGGNGSTADPGNARRVRLSDSMTSLGSNPEGVRYTAPYMFEASDIWKWNGIYYLNYTTHWSSSGSPYGFANIDVAYMMNRDGVMAFPTSTNAVPSAGSWGAPKRLLPNGSYGDSTNHASLFDFKGQPYLVYHASSACQAYDVTRLRVAHLVAIDVREDDGTANAGTLRQINRDGTVKTADGGRPAMGFEGAAQVGDFNPYNVTEAETMAIGGGIYTKQDGEASNGISVASIDTGDWLGLYGVDFDLKGGGAKAFNAVVKLPVTANEEPYIGAIEIRLNPEQQGIANPADNTRLGTGNNAQTRITGGEVIGRVWLETIKKDDEGKWLRVNATLNKTVTGKHDLAFVFYSSAGPYLERHTATPTQANDGRARNVGFEIDRWWFE